MWFWPVTKPHCASVSPSECNNHLILFIWVFVLSVWGFSYRFVALRVVHLGTIFTPKSSLKQEIHREGKESKMGWQRTCQTSLVAPNPRSRKGSDSTKCFINSKKPQVSLKILKQFTSPPLSCPKPTPGHSDLSPGMTWCVSVPVFSLQQANIALWGSLCCLVLNLLVHAVSPKASHS